MDILSYLQPGWNLRLGTKRLVIDAPNEGAAYDLITNASEQLALSVANLRFKEVRISWDGCLPATFAGIGINGRESLKHSRDF